MTVATVLLLAQLGTAEEAPPFKNLKQAKAAVKEFRAATLKRLDRGRLLIPEVFLEADAKSREALGAWWGKRFEEALATYDQAWARYSQCLGLAEKQHASLTALREKRPPELRIAFKQRKAVHFALEWLAKHQDPLGRWDCVGFMKHDPNDDRCDGGGLPAYDVGVTALVLLTFLEAGYTDRNNHYALEVYRGLQWLRAQQDNNGLFGPDKTHFFFYNHAIATLALAKAFALTKDKRFEPCMKRATALILKARSPGRGGWRYEIGGDEVDTSMTTWCVRALTAARDAGVAIDTSAAEKGSRRWLDSMTLADGRVGYQYKGNLARPERKERFPEDRSRAMTAAGTVLRLALDGKKHDKALVLRSLDRCLERPPNWSSDGSIDMYYWYYGTLAVRIDKKRARKWKTPLHKALLGRQHRKGACAGSWDPVGVWGVEGGRVYATATLALALIHAG